MSVTDPIADMLTRIRNAAAVRQNFTLVPASRLKRAIARARRSGQGIHHAEGVGDYGDALTPQLPGEGHRRGTRIYGYHLAVLNQSSGGAGDGRLLRYVLP